MALPMRCCATRNASGFANNRGWSDRAFVSRSDASSVPIREDPSRTQDDILFSAHSGDDAGQVKTGSRWNLRGLTGANRTRESKKKHKKWSKLGNCSCRKHQMAIKTKGFCAIAGQKLALGTMNLKLLTDPANGSRPRVYI
jgi:hypothetical protein